jgi:hypothetical protein
LRTWGSILRVGTVHPRQHPQRQSHLPRQEQHPGWLFDNFDKLDIRFFVMGFGYGELSPFSLAVLKRWKASPKVVVINADPFFVDVLSEPAKEALEGRPAFLWITNV